MLRAANLSPEQGIQLLATLMAAYDYSTALLQWPYVPEKILATTHAIPAETRDCLNKTVSGPGKIQLPGIPLAGTMHLQRLVAIDSQHYSVRNIRIASNMANAASLKHQRVLIIIGAAREHFLDDYLSRLESVQLVKLSSLPGIGEKASVTPGQDSKMAPA